MFDGNRKIYSLFGLCLLVRIIFKLISPADNFELFYDSIRYDNLSQQIISGDFDLDIIAYLTAPLYPYTLALFKTISLTHWQILTIIFQFLLVAFSAVFIYKIALQLFKNEVGAFIAGLIYIFYPLTLWYNFTIVQETSFQAYFVFFIYHFIKICDSGKIKNTVYASLWFSLAMLTKSHIVMLIPFLIIILSLNKRLQLAVGFIVMILIATIPHGLVNLKLHNVYTLGSQGNASLFLLGHSDDTYPCLTHSSGEMGTYSTTGCDPSIVFDTAYVYQGYGQVNKLAPKERNSLRLEIAKKWIKNNPNKFLELKWHGIKRFVLPGLDYKVYKFSYWFLSLFLGLLIYVPAYWILYKSIKRDPIKHLLCVSLILSIVAIFIVFFPINRFRIITLEPLLMVYAGQYYSRYHKKIKSLLFGGQ